MISTYYMERDGEFCRLVLDTEKDDQIFSDPIAGVNYMRCITPRLKETYYYKIDRCGCTLITKKEIYRVLTRGSGMVHPEGVKMLDAIQSL